MLEMLCATSSQVHWDRDRYGGIFHPNNFIASEHALVNRGLLERKTLKELNAEQAKALARKRGEYVRPVPWRLTPAGVALVHLLKVGGLFIAAQTARERLSQRKGSW